MANYFISEREPVELRGYFMRHKSGGDAGFSWKKDDPQFSADWERIVAVPEIAPASTPQQPAQRASVDTPEFSKLLSKVLECYAQDAETAFHSARAALIAHIDARGSAGSPTGAVPAGWKLVPVEPTPEMIAAMQFRGDVEIAVGHGLFYKEAVEDYAAMLAAAPLPAPQGEQA